MDRKSKPVEIIGIDTDTLEKDSTFPEAYAIYITLSDEPDSIWQNYLSKWENALKYKKRALNIAGDKLRLVFVYGDDIRSFVEYARYLVHWVNDRIEEYNKKAELKEKGQRTIQDIEQKKEDDIRKKLKELEPEPSIAAVEVTVDELLSAYEADEVTADARFGNRILKVTGLVDRIEVKGVADIQYITLSSANKNLLQNVRCMFDKGHRDKLKGLAKGETATVQGKFRGSIAEFLMRDCVLVR